MSVNCDGIVYFRFATEIDEQKPEDMPASGMCCPHLPHLPNVGPHLHARPARPGRRPEQQQLPRHHRHRVLQDEVKTQVNTHADM